MSHQEQPAPIANDRPAVWPLVIADMKARDRLGRERYGVPLQPGNGRDALRDAYEEALDLCAYLRQAICERDGDDDALLEWIEDAKGNQTAWHSATKTGVTVYAGEVGFDWVGATAGRPDIKLGGQAFATQSEARWSAQMAIEKIRRGEK